LRVVAGGECNKNLQQIALLKRQHSTRRCETRWLRSFASDNGFNDRVCR
jgi:hypothetical protein